MNGPAPALILSCPQCGKKYQGDPSKPEARYLCPADRSVLQRATPPPPPAPRATIEVEMGKDAPAPAPPPPSPRITQPVEPPSPRHDTQPIDMSPFLSPRGDDDSATRVLSGDDAGRAAFPDPAATRVLSPPHAPSAASSALTMGTLSEHRRSVLSLLQHRNSPAAAALLKEKYEMVGKLGQGGVGEVWKVRDRDLNREVAMKLLLAGTEGSADSVNRFIEEAQATGQLEHPNIVPVHDLGVDGQGRVYFTLKYVQGLSLRSVIRGRNENAQLEDGSGFLRDRFTPLRMVEILIAMCQGVAYAHSKGIIHRDLKPDNVMLGKYGEVLVMDWGLAKVLDKTRSSALDDTVRVMTTRSGDGSQLTMEGSIAGTPAYMAPEQAAGRISELDQRTDIYALGAILYEVLSGHPPYEGGSALELVKRVTQEPPPPLSKGAHGFHPIPRELKAICEMAMARDPRHRYATASLLRDDLQAFLEDRPVSAAPDSPWQRAMKWVRRNRRQVKTSGLSAAAVALVFFSVWFGWREVQVRRSTADALSHLAAARDAIRIQSRAVTTNADAYGYQSNTASRSRQYAAARADLNAAIASLLRALDRKPGHARLRLLLAESHMELWRLALAEGNAELARSHRLEVERFAPSPSPFRDELNGFGSLAITFEPAETVADLFVFETLLSQDASGRDLPARLIPVPFDVSRGAPDTAFLESERTRIKAGRILPAMEARHTIFNLDAPPSARAGVGSVRLDRIPPGSYLLVARAPGHIEIRVPIVVPRLGRVERRIVLPREGELPPLFFYMAGGEVTVGGDTAGAPAPHTMSIPPSLLFHDEISMGEYAAFLRDLARRGRGAEVRQRLPKDFGRLLATLSPAGMLLPADGSDPIAFSRSPVRGVSYNDAMAYVAWRTAQDGLAYRLPRDWEWEAACRGADARLYSWGDSPGKGLAAVTQGYGDTGSGISWRWEDYKDESPWGFHNLAGGAAEWTMSRYDPKAKPEDPVFGQLAIRGNAWALPPVGLACAFRTSGQPDYFHPTIGFRLALDYPVKRVGNGSAASPATSHAH
jgi:serine/threonine protein kinase/formylglycine-generating enzyme required for sulfatase activity